MKQKYLLGMLLGGALLTACSVEDDFNPANVAQDVNPSAPVFTVSFDNGGDALTRAAFNNGQMTFQNEDKATGRKADLLSLYHGIQAGAFTTTYQNAIYAPSGEMAADGVFQWTTNSMVLGGTAVMMYPANTDAKAAPGWTGAPVASIGAEQTEASMTKLPYVSAGLDIKATGGKAADKNEAGYAKEYDIRMKPLASIVRLGLNENLDELKETLAGIVDEFEIKEVTLKSTNSGSENKIFTTSAPITLTSVTAPTGHKTWTYKVGLDVAAMTGVEKSGTISTEWIPEEGGKLVANLPLLPFVATGTPTLGDLELAVKTTFGTVYITSKNAENQDNKVVSHPYFKDNASIDASATKAVQDKLKNFIESAKRTDKLTLNEAFEKIVEPVVDDQTLGSTSFPNEYAGQSIQLAVDVDLNNVDLREMHLETSKDLITAIKVYDKLGKTYDAKFYLDGGKEVANTFVMTDEALDLVMDQIGKKNNKIKFIPCATHNGKVIRLDNEDNPAKEIPDLLLTMDENVTSVPVELAGAWKFTGKENAAEAIKLLNIQSLTVLKDATLNLDNWIQTVNIPAKDNTPAVIGGLKGTDENANGIIVNKGGTVNVAGETVLKVNVENSGTINIGKDTDAKAVAELYVGGATNLTNNAAEKNDKDDWANYWEEGGKIYNYGSFGVLTEKDIESGSIDNYGVIYVKKADAVTYVTNNADKITTITDKGANVTVAYSETNRIGSIVLFDKDGSDHNTKVGEASTQGFIKLYIKSGSVNSTAVGDVANYIVATSGMTGNVEANTTNNNVKYIEFNGVDGVKIYTNKFDAIVVDADSKVTVPENVTLRLEKKALYLKGTLRYGGTLAGSEEKWDLYESVFGTSDGKLINTGSGTIED